MLPEERLRVLVFLSAVGAVYVCSGLLAARAWRARTSAHGLSRGERALFQLSSALALVGFLCGAYGIWIEPYWPAVEHVSLNSKKLAHGEHLRIVHISDVHSDPEPRLETELPALIAAQAPDLIVFTGDAINSPDGLSVFKPFLAALARIAPTVAVRGNWDVWYWSELKLFDGTGAQEVANSAVSVAVRGRNVWVGGLSVDGQQALPALLAAAPRSDLHILLHHYPDWAYEASEHGADLYLAGHTHGGQVALPWYGALVTFSRFGKRFESGLHQIDGMWLYVNRGIGMEGGAAPRVRFCARPEVTVLDISGR